MSAIRPDTVQKSKVSKFKTDYESCVGVSNILQLKCQTCKVWHMFTREFGFTHYTRKFSNSSKGHCCGNEVSCYNTKYSKILKLDI